MRRLATNLQALLSRDGCIVIHVETQHADGSIEIWRNKVPVRQLRVVRGGLAYYAEDGRVHAFAVDGLEHVGEEWLVHVDGHDHFRLVIGPLRGERERQMTARWRTYDPSPVAEHEMRELLGRFSTRPLLTTARARGGTDREWSKPRPSEGGADA